MQNNTTSTNAIIASQDTNSTKDVCLAMYNGEIHLNYRSLRTLLQAISVAEKDAAIGIYASTMKVYIEDSAFSSTYANDEACLKVILGVLITLL